MYGQLWLVAWHGLSLGVPLASLISFETLQQALGSFGYPAVLLFVMIESLGVPFPGETMLLLASFSAATNPRLQIPIVIACAALGAIVGDNIGYYIGLKGGRPFVARFGRYFFVKPEHLDYAEKFFAKHGNKTVFLGRFTAILRTWAAFLAGVNHMPWRAFLIYNAAGGIIWATIYGILGFVAGNVFKNNFPRVEQIASQVSWVTLSLAIVIVVAAIIFWRARRSRQKQSEQREKERTPVV
ncbi:MAG TPA: DedA family protein [Ktedonosporobacter sp.]|nr:DedA family protein [Ktedonosporobacter sp.]